MADTKFVARDGKARVEVSSDLQKFIEDRFDQIAPQYRRELERELSWLVANALKQWPVRTGYSKEGLAKAIEVESIDVILGKFFNDVPYARFVRRVTGKKGRPPSAKQIAYERRLKENNQWRGSAGTYRGRHAMTEFMRKPFENAEDRLEEVFVQAIMELI